MLVSMKPVEKHEPERGTIFVVVVAVIMLVSVLMLLGSGTFHLPDDNERTQETIKRQEFLIRELSSYVQRTNRLPCPADPAVDPESREFGFARASCGLYSAVGIVPFRTLNLSEHDARDGWGRLMTYKMSPVLANTQAGHRIFMRCRRLPWFQDNPPPPAESFNVYPEKARFCCPPDDGDFPPSSDLRVHASSADIPGNVTIGKIGRKDDPSMYDDINKPVNVGGQGALSPIPANAGNEELFALAIISHGRNGVGAYLANRTVSKITGSASRDELVNAADGLAVVSRNANPTPGPDYFDDIVIWRTQIGLMGELNNVSCYAPWH